MIVKQTGKIVTGAHLTEKERQGLQIEIMKELADLNRKNYNEIDAMFLWWAHVKLGYGYDRLKALHHDFAPGLMDLCDRYEIHEPGDNVWLCTKKLLDIGVDVAAWNAELKKEKEEE